MLDGLHQTETARVIALGQLEVEVEELLPLIGRRWAEHGLAAHRVVLLIIEAAKNVHRGRCAADQATVLLSFGDAGPIPIGVEAHEEPAHGLGVGEEDHFDAVAARFDAGGVDLHRPIGWHTDGVVVPSALDCLIKVGLRCAGDSDETDCQGKGKTNRTRVHGWFTLSERGWFPDSAGRAGYWKPSPLKFGEILSEIVLREEREKALHGVLKVALHRFPKPDILNEVSPEALSVRP